ncbi:bifunctional Regulator of chromosome condensation [Babesia duncani]|uniref:Bifunctional Regulator of chromosome condensation n=1 Tax=Babesia duncani TaxID=323732 RepID=A0AAD9UND9_9APIC|nr:bifunctional Regulator of chromosome condensation [Babesia duncani]
MSDSLIITIPNNNVKSANQKQPKTVIIEAESIISTRSIDHVPNYRDLSTVVYIWGENPACIDSPAKDQSDKEPWKPTIYKNIKDIRILELKCSNNAVYFLSGYRTVYVLGHGEYGQLGLGDTVKSVREPTILDTLGNIKQLACGDYHALALDYNGRLFSWGRNDLCGHCNGISTFTPMEILINTIDTNISHRINWTCIGASNSYTIAVCNEGTSLYSWGVNFYGKHIPEPQLFYSLSMVRVNKICVGKKFAVALTECGRLFTWGDGSFGEIQINCPSIELKMSPVLFKHKDIKEIVSISVGYRHVLLIDKQGKVWSFGDNIYGQCGTSLGNICKPGIVTFIGNFVAKQISCGPRNSACINTGNQLFTWGHSGNNKLIFTTATENLVQQQRQPGVSMFSGLKGSCTTPRIIYSLLHEKVTNVGFGENYTVVVTGDGIVPYTSSENETVL